MPETIDSLLVKLGLETDDEGFKEAKSLFDGVTTTALQFGSVIGAGLGVQNLTFGFANAKEALGRFAEKFGTTAQFVDSLGFAFEQTGGDADEAFSLIRRMKNLMEDTQWGEIAERAFRIQGINPMMLQGVTGVEDAIKVISDAVRQLSPEAARRFVRDMGLSENDLGLMRGTGNEDLRTLLKEGEELAKVTKEMTDQAINFNSEVGRLSKAVEGITNQFSALIIDDFADSMKQATDFLKENNQQIIDFFKDALPILKDISFGIGALIILEGGKRGAAGLLKILGSKTGMLGLGALAVYGGLEMAKDYDETTQQLRDQGMDEEADRREQHVLRSAGGAGGAFMMQLPREMRMGPPSESTTHNNSITQNNTVHIDARGISDPEAIGKVFDKKAGELTKMAIRDLETPVK